MRPRPQSRWRHPILLALLALVPGGLAVSVMANPESSPSSAWPPSAYRLDSARLSVLRNPAHGLPIQRVSINGAGEGVLDREGRQATFRMDRNSLLALVNEFYRIRFFDLPERLLPPRSVFPKDDGTVGTQTLRVFDAGTTAVCFAVTGYRKCVEYESAGPPELENLVRRLFTDAGTLASQPKPR